MQPPRQFVLGLRRPSLTAGLVLAVVVYALLAVATDLDGRARFIDAWDIGASFALVVMFFRLRGSSAAEMKSIAVKQDVGKWPVLVLSLVAATASLIVIGAEMPLIKTVDGLERVARVVLVVYTILLSWTFIHTMFALHYAHEYYFDIDLARDSHARDLRFPGDRTPTYGDFVYFAFTIGMTFQVSDVQIANAAVRRLVLAHGVLAFFYSTVVLALAINLVAGLI